MKITKEDLDEAVEQLAILEFWKSDGAFVGSVKGYLAKICPNLEALRWLTDALVNHIGKWPGPKEVRGLLCTRCDAADGIDEYCTLPGFSPVDFERKHLEKHQALIDGTPKLFDVLGVNARPKAMLPEANPDDNWETGCATCGRYPTVRDTEQCRACMESAA